MIKVTTNLYRELGQAKLRLRLYEYMLKVYKDVEDVFETEPERFEMATNVMATHSCYWNLIATYSDEMDDFRQIMFKLDNSNDEMYYNLPELNLQRETDWRENNFFVEAGGTIQGIRLRIEALVKAIDLVRRKIKNEEPLNNYINNENDIL